jgi:DNA-binding response OmpR family regulator
MSTNPQQKIVDLKQRRLQRHEDDGVLLLWADDKERGQLQDRLRKQGYSVEAYGSAEDGLNALEAASWPTIVVDDDLPDRDALDFAKVLRVLSVHSGAQMDRCRVVGVSHKTVDEKSWRECGVSAWLRKPVDENVIARCITSVGA